MMNASGCRVSRSRRARERVVLLRGAFQYGAFVSGQANGGDALALVEDGAHALVVQVPDGEGVQGCREVLDEGAGFVEEESGGPFGQVQGAAYFADRGGVGQGLAADGAADRFWHFIQDGLLDPGSQPGLERAGVRFEPAGVGEGGHRAGGVQVIGDDGREVPGEIRHRVRIDQTREQRIHQQRRGCCRAGIRHPWCARSIRCSLFARGFRGFRRARGFRGPRGLSPGFLLAFHETKSTRGVRHFRPQSQPPL
ncbi:hypothetical protein [Paenarthrobacter sp. PH39-S1]|uniref:hypothetical protein n=1 Tax=Paenarthrobacter sp. PH39-S1 TaxID=3046204 RepID=UPI0024BBCDE7|nr:hypothetical protein [Paenarthrobacter sp. PH39-S1]MDJ0354876.1 hypothetical protein [Paenarthrobacter sp. PH39-S1]